MIKTLPSARANADEKCAFAHATVLLGTLQSILWTTVNGNFVVQFACRCGCVPIAL